MPINLTGKPDLRDINLGRGIIYIAELDANLLPIDWLDLGNAPEFNVTIESEELLHQSSRAGLKVTDIRVTLSQDASVAFRIEELNHGNLALFFTGTVSTVTNPAVAGVASMGAPVAITANVVLGRWYDLKTAYNGTGISTSFSATSVPKIRRTSGTPMDLVLGTDYEIDRVMGRVFILSTAVNVVAADDIGWYSAADATAPAQLQLMKAFKAGVKSYALKFIGENPLDSSRLKEWEFHKTSLAADGDLSLIGDEFTNLGFSGAAEKNSNVNVDGTLTIRDHPRS